MRRFPRPSVTKAPLLPTRSPLSKPLDVVLHIGTGKTGTSSVQFFLRDNRERLLELGYLYPKSPGGARHGRLSLFVQSDEELLDSPNWYRQNRSDPVRFRKAFRRRLFSEIESSGVSRILLSDEVLFMQPDRALQRLRRLTDRIAGSLRLVVYLRRQDDHMVSRYQQGVKIGWVVRLRDWAQEDMSSLYDYHARLCTWQRLLEPTELVVRRFEPESFVDGSLYQDFLDAAGIKVRAEDLEVVPKRNESLDAECVEFLRLLNLHRVENEGETPGVIDNRHLVKRLSETSTGPVLTLPAAFLDTFMAQWEESNRRVALDILGDESGQLFHMPRKIRDSTTSQHLDPARLDHFLELAELPDRLHAPLRRLAEREVISR
jgi:hypothetical protein